MNNFPRIPVRFVHQNDEMLKGSYAGGTEGGTDYKQDTHVPSASTIVPSYRVPADRVNGNEFFRRNPNGSLDLDYAVQKVVDAIHNITEGLEPSMFDQICLSCFYPGAFSHYHVPSPEPAQRTLLKILPEEAIYIMMGVHAHLAAERVYSTGSHSV